MWKYVKRYLPFAILAGLLMVGEVSMDLVQPGLLSQIVDDGVLGVDTGGVGDMSVIWHVGILMIITTVFGGFCGSLNNVSVNFFSQNVGNEIRKDCFRNIMKFSFAQVEEFGSGSLITRVTNDITQIQLFVSQFCRGVIRTTMLTFGSIFCMYRLSTHFGMVTLAALPLILATIVICLLRANPEYTKLQGELDTINQIMQEDVSGIRIIKACVRETYERIRFGKANDDLVNTQLITLYIFAIMSPVVNIIMYVVVTVILWLGSYEAAAGLTTPGVIMAAITYTTQLINGVMMLNMLFQSISRGYASWKRTRKILDTKPELNDGTFDGQTDVKGEVEFKDVSFHYPNSDEIVLDHINLKIHPGETMAIMGATGCGKTTLANLIPRFNEVTGGAVLVDGVDVRDYEQKALRDKIAVALQKSELFNASIADNISWGSPGASREEIKEAAQVAQAEEFINSEPDGYDAMVAERGTSLSGGQKQRLSVARAVLKPAEIMIFDDSTSALDIKTEADLSQALAGARPKTTKIIIAQRVATVMRADRIAVLENGRIIACGSHEELLKTCPSYRDIYDSQMGEEAAANA